MDFNEVFKNELADASKRMKHEELLMMAREVYEMFTAHIQAGFTEKQALQIVIGIITAGANKKND